MDMFGLVVQFHVTPGREAEFDELVARTVAGVHANEPDTLAYLAHTVDGEPSTRLFYELYASKDAKNFHDAQDYVAHFMAEREQYLQGRTVQRLTPQKPWPHALEGEGGTAL